MKRINPTGKEFAIYRFRRNSDGEIVKEYSTAEDYNARFIGADNPPQKEGCTWLTADRATEYDTPTGEMNDGEYAVQGKRFICKVNGRYSSLEVSAVKKVLGKNQEDSIKEFKKPEVVDLIHIDAVAEIRALTEEDIK